MLAAVSMLLTQVLLSTLLCSKAEKGFVLLCISLTGKMYHLQPACTGTRAPFVPKNVVQVSTVTTCH
jgi:hypothetical protein